MRRHRLRNFLIIAALLVVVALVVAVIVRGDTGPVGYEPQDPPPSFGKLGTSLVVTPDLRPAFQFDPAQSWQIDLGRGSGMDGLETVALASDGRTVLHRARGVRQGNGYSRIWEKATLTLPTVAAQRIAEAVNAENLPDLGRMYDATNVFDGTQWVLWVRQGGREKVVYLNNHFPEPVVRFAAAVDAQVVAVGDAVRWRGVPFWEYGRHDDDLWNALRR